MDCFVGITLNGHSEKTIKRDSSLKNKKPIIRPQEVKAWYNFLITAIRVNKQVYRQRDPKKDSWRDVHGSL